MIYPNLLKKLILPIADKVTGTSIHKYYWMIKELRQYSRGDINEFQIEQLKDLISHSYKNVEYYNKLFKSIDLYPDEVNSFEILKEIPILTKSIIRENFDLLISKGINKNSYKTASTGGSTGIPLRYNLDKKSWSYTNADSIVNWEKTNYRYGRKFIALGSTSLFINESRSLKHEIYYKLKGKIGFNGINMSDEVCHNYIEYINKNEIKFLYGYASAIYLLAAYALKKQLKSPIQVCFTTSEKLTISYYQTIKAAFNCDILDCYGAHDGGVSAFSLNAGVFEVGYNCIIRDESSKRDQIVPAIITDLFNYSMPFINYEIGDEVIINDDKSNIYNGQQLKEVMGRSSEVIVLENGRKITGPGFTILFKDIPVAYYYIEKNGKNSIRCSIIKTNKFKEIHTELIMETFHKQFGEDVLFELKFTDKVFYSKSGKRKYFSNSEAEN